MKRLRRLLGIKQPREVIREQTRERVRRHRERRKAVAPARGAPTRPVPIYATTAAGPGGRSRISFDRYPSPENGLTSTSLGR